MSTLLLNTRFGAAKRARILPMVQNTVRPSVVRNPMLTRAEGSCELNAVLEDVLADISEKHDNKYIAPLSEGALSVRCEDTVLKRVLGFIFEGMFAAGLWRDGEAGCISPLLCTCRDGYGALLEFTDETISLSRELVIQFSKHDLIRSPNLVGWQLLKARDVIENHGGRLCIESPLNGEKTGTSIRLFLPLAANAVRRNPVQD